MTSFLRFFLTWWGALVLGALDSTPFFFVPFGTDALVVYLAARDRSLFWLYPVLTTAGSIAGTVLTYTIGVTIGDTGLVRFVPQHRLERLRTRVKDIGAIAMGISAALPPPFPMTAFVLTCGALKVSRARFLTVVAVARLVRFGVEATLARRYGRSVVRLLESDAAQRIILGLVVVSIAGTVLTIVRVWRSTRAR
ncbi:MAG TPA: VTT domain-containing protein [Vicinamibacterales bacterium]|nr:VTT domain-containing protein [Vicinamibacterales bacterium]